jgi:hypothetical protein
MRHIDIDIKNVEREDWNCQSSISTCNGTQNKRRRKRILVKCSILVAQIQSGFLPGLASFGNNNEKRDIYAPPLNSRIYKVSGPICSGLVRPTIPAYLKDRW